MVSVDTEHAAGESQVVPHDNEPDKLQKKYTRQEVAAHNKIEDCWFAYKNKVYDVTKFVPLHPAGP